MQNSKIRDIKVHLVSKPISGGFADATRKVETVGFTIVRLTTDDGIEGFGVTYHEVGGEATKLMIEKNIRPKLIGRDPFETEAIWNELVAYLRGVGRKGLMFCALSAIDIALWDLKGKILNMPLYKMFGGAETKFPFTGAAGGPPTRTRSSWKRWSIWSRPTDTRRSNSKSAWRAGTTPTATWSGSARCARPWGRRSASCWTRTTAGTRRRARGSPTGSRTTTSCFSRSRSLPTTSRASSNLRTPRTSRSRPASRNIPSTGRGTFSSTAARTSCSWTGPAPGGFTEMLKIGALTQAFNVKFAPHAMENIHIHLVSAFGNAPFLERLKLFEGITADTYLDAPKPDHGFMTIPDLPGLGLKLNMDFINEYDEKI